MSQSARSNAGTAASAVATDHGAHDATDSPCEVAQIIEHAAHLLPSQGPIRVFIHHNTLHAFEHLPFHEAVKRGGATYGCHPYLPEDRYREKLVARADPVRGSGGRADRGPGRRRRSTARVSWARAITCGWRCCSIRCGLGRDDELRWLIAETDALRQFRSETPFQVREQMIERTRRWVMRDLRSGRRATGITCARRWRSLFEQFGESRIEQWSDETWEAFTLHALWRICHRGVHAVQRFHADARRRSFAIAICCCRRRASIPTGWSMTCLIRFCAAFLDQGVSSWPLPGARTRLFASRSLRSL